MKIVIAAEIFSPDIGGPATYSEIISHAFVERGWDVTLICYSDEKHKDTFPFAVYRILRSQKKRLHYIKYFFTLLYLSFDADIIYAMGPVSSGKPATILRRYLGKRVVVKVVGDYAWEQARISKLTDTGIDDFQKDKLSGRIRALKATEQETCNGASAIIVPSNYLKSMVLGWNVNPDKIHVVYNAAPAANYNRHEDTEHDLIITMGRLVSWKGFASLIDIMPSLRTINKKFKLVILGKGPDERMLQKQIDDLYIENSVQIVYVDANKRDEYFAKGMMFVLNTDYEGFSHALLEAMAKGIPIITTDVGGNPELVANGKNGLLVHYDDKEAIKQAIITLYQDEKKRRQFRVSSYEIASHFSIKKMIQETVYEIESIVK